MEDMIILFFTNGKPGYRFFTAKLRGKSQQRERRIHESKRKKQTNSKR